MKQSFLFKPLGVALVLALALAAVLYTMGTENLKTLEHIQLQQKIRYRAQKPQKFPDKIVMIELNNQSVHYQRRWPWTQAALAKLIKEVRAKKPKVIALELPLLRKPPASNQKKTKKVVEFYTKFYPELDEKGKEKLKKRLRRMSRSKRREYFRRQKRIELVRLKLKSLLSKEDPAELLRKEIKATPQLVLGYRYYGSEREIEGIDMSYIKKKRKALKNAKKAKAAPPKKAKKGKKGAKKEEKKKPKFPVDLYHLNTASFIVGASVEPAPEAAEIRENAQLSPLVRYHGFNNISSNRAKMLLDVPLFMRHKDKTYPSLALAAYIAWKNGAVPKRIVNSAGYVGLQLGSTLLPLTPEGSLSLYYYGDMSKLSTEQRIPGGDVLTGKNSNAEDIHSKLILEVKDKIVLIGLSSTSKARNFRTPFARPFSSLEVQANVLANLLDRKTMRRTSKNKYIELGLLIVLGLLMGLLMSKLRYVGGLLALVALSAILVFVDRFFLFPSGLWLHMIFLHLSLVVFYVGISGVRAVTGDKIRRQTEERFRQRVSKNDFQALLNAPHQVKEEGLRLPITYIAGEAEPIGSSIPEEMKAEKVTKLLSSFAHPIAEAISRNRGTLNVISSHSFQAFFNAPIPVKNHEEQGCQTALQMKFAWEAFLGLWQQEDLPPPEMAMGLDTSNAVVGNIGSGDRFIYTAVGEAVEFSERLLQLNRYYKSHILISERMYEAIKESGKFVVRELDWIRLQEDQAAIVVYELLGDQTSSPIPAESVEKYHEGLQHYRQRNFQEASKSFQEALNARGKDGPAEVMLKRSQHYIHYPPSFQWDGSWKLVGQ